MVDYVRMVVSLIEARWVSRTEILQMLEKVLRQHTMVRRRKIDHAVSWLHEHPP
jgi:NADH pyrophosphatase NudC (nudix superfamily)